MLDFAEGWTWFLAGLGATLLFFLLLLVMVFFARRSETRQQPHAVARDTNLDGRRQGRPRTRP